MVLLYKETKRGLARSNPVAVDDDDDNVDRTAPKYADLGANASEEGIKLKKTDTKTDATITIVDW